MDLDVQTATGAVVVGIIVLVAGRILFAAIIASAKAWKNRYWQGTARRASVIGQFLNDVRRTVVARERTRLVARREMLSRWRRTPIWLLRATLFRWFENSPATDWPYVQCVLERHANDEAKAQAEALLWDTRAVTDLRTRDRIMENRHVALVHPCSDVVFVLTNADSHGHSERRYETTAQIRVQRGWCANTREPGDSCRYCDMSDQELDETSDRLMASHECPSQSDTEPS